MSEFVTRAEYERLLTRRVHATDKALSAMLAVLTVELADDPAGVDQVRGLVVNIRTALCQRYPFAAAMVGSG